MRVVPWVLAGALLVLVVQGECAARGNASIEAREDTLAAQRAEASHLRSLRSQLRPPTILYRDRWRGYHFDSLSIARGPDTLCVPKVVILTADAALRADSALQVTTDSLADLESRHAATAERQASAWKSVARPPWLTSSIALLGSQAPSVRLEGELVAGRGWQVVLRGTLEADTAGSRRRLEAGIRKTFRLF